MSPEDDKYNTDNPQYIFKTHPKEIVSIIDLRFDLDNPNEMDEESLKSLDYSMDKWGYIDPIVIDQDNMIANGEHRVKVLQDKGIQQLEVIRYKFKNDNERKLFRQTMNKLKGRHNLEKDVIEMSLLSDADELNELSKLIGVNEAALNYVVDQHKGILDELEAINNTTMSSGNKNRNNDEEQNELDDIETKNKCPKCHYTW